MMKNIIFTFAMLFSSTSVFAQNAGIALGSFADSFAKGMAQNAEDERMQLIIQQQRQRNRDQYGTGEIQRLDKLEQYADVRINEYVKELFQEKETQKSSNK